MTTDQHIRKLITGMYQDDWRTDLPISDLAEKLIDLAIDGMVEGHIEPDQVMACRTRGEFYELIRQLPELALHATPGELSLEELQEGRNLVDRTVQIFDQQIAELEAELDRRPPT
ncbi:hypothetical protein [Aeoliella sp.]|uniref:hypothetical protein n=1 Tax=Aeoliella sp. TaxID=2795800 RepID=UPI003CCBE642